MKFAQESTRSPRIHMIPVLFQNTKKDQNVLAALNAPKPQNSPPQQGIPPFMNQNKPIVPDQKQQPVVADKKIGRNDKVLIKKGSETKTIKFKKAEALLKEGWEIVDS